MSVDFYANHSGAAHTVTAQGFIRVFFEDDAWATVPARKETTAQQICDVRPFVFRALSRVLSCSCLCLSHSLSCAV